MFTPPPPPRYGSYELASWGYRAGALGVDVLIAIAVGVTAWGLGRLGGMSGTRALGLGTLAALFGWPLVMAIPMGVTKGQSAGKRLASLHVVRDTGQPAGFWWSIVRDSFARGLFFFIPFAVLVDYLMATGVRHQTLHDKMTGTHVVRGPVYKKRQVPTLLGGLAGLAAVIGVFVAISAADHRHRLYGGYTVAERDGFVHGCAKNADRKTCGCIYDYLEKHMRHSKFEEWGRRYYDDPEHTHLPKEFLDAGDHCVRSPSPSSPGESKPQGA
jgi:uncharacterized RDD family membrane protein YckC